MKQMIVSYRTVPARPRFDQVSRISLAILPCILVVCDDKISDRRRHHDISSDPLIQFVAVIQFFSYFKRQLFHLWGNDQCLLPNSEPAGFYMLLYHPDSQLFHGWLLLACCCISTNPMDGWMD